MESLHELVSLLQDPAAVQKILAGELAHIMGEGGTLHTLTVDYFRQSHTRVSIQYTLDLEDGRGTRAPQVLTVAHFTDGRTEQLWQHFSVDAPDASERSGPFGLPGAWYSVNLRAIVQAFPFDFRLPGLRRVAAGAPAIRSLLEEAGTVPPAEPWQADVVRYRPDMRAMAKIALDAQGADGRRQHVYAKVYRDGDEGQRAFDLLRALDASGRSHGGFRVPQPLAYEPELRTLLISEVVGTRLLDIVRANGDDRAPGAVRGAARAVAAMHDASVPPSLLPAVSHSKDAQFAEVADRLEQSYPDHAAAVRSVVDQISASFQPAPLRPTHYDLKQGHMLIDDDTVTIIDFDKMALGDPLIDVANVVATLGAEREGSARRAARRGGLADVFVDEYFQHVPADWAQLFPAHLARATLLEAATTGRGQRGRKGASRPEDRLVFALRRAEEALAV
ncbi:MAG: phosphotransferase [Thermomicrobiales bacterium]|nr:phosphotransferase [Thermomicrobiales bacterium]